MDGVLTASAGEAVRPRLKSISCPSCGAAAGSLTPGDVRACPYCGVPLTIAGAGAVGSGTIEPRVAYEHARHAVETFLGTPGTPEALREGAARRGIELVFIPFFDMILVEAAEERPPVRCRLSAVRLCASALEDGGRAVGADRIDMERVRATPSVPFDAVALAGRGTVLDPQRDPDTIRLPSILSQPVTIERRVKVLYYPVWLARFSYGRSLYQVVVDGVTGETLRGVAPCRMDRRVLEGVGFTLLFSVLIGLVVAEPRLLFEAAIHITDVGAFVAGGLLLVLATAWDRLRFRREVVVEGGARRYQPINRPKETTLEQIAHWLISAARSRSGRSGGILGP